ncbi:MAG: FHA domain-containing protein [Candidatus Methanofastidiosia archaeon]|jgi:hypothetical protein
MKCPSCGEENPFGTVFCKSCGCDLSSVAGEAQAGVRPPVEPYKAEPEKRIMKEEPQAQKEKQVQCSCGALNPSQANFCYKCGNPLSKEGPVPHLAAAHIILPDGGEIPIDAPEVEVNREHLMDRGVGPEDYMKISQKHCKIIREEDQYYIKDVGTHGTGSTNGTYIPRIGEIKGKKKVLLRDGDEIILGTAAKVQFKLS